MSKNHNVPQVRFKGFTDAWEQRELGSVSEKVTKKNQDMVCDEVFTNSAEYGIISQRDFFDKDIANSENIDGYYIVEPNDFVYNPRISNLAPFGPIRRNKLEKSGAMSPLYYVFRTHGVDYGFLEYYFKTNGWHSFMHLNGNSGARSDRFAIRDDVFREMPITMPQNVVEQQAIGKYFTNLDHLITLHQRKCDSLKKIKKAMLQKMFPKNGENVPEIRFKGFTDAWEQRELGEVIESVKNGYAYKADGSRTHKYKLTRIETISTGEINTEKLGSSEIINDTYRLLDGDILFSHINSLPYIGNTAIYSANLGEIYHGMNLLNIRANQHLIEPYFLLYLLKKEESRDWFRVVAKPAVNQCSIATADVVKFIFSLPNLKEQTAISTYFRNLDNLITLHQRKLETLKKLKKSMLQKMFPA